MEFSGPRPFSIFVNLSGSMSSLTLASGDYLDVHLRFWTNWSHGKVRGTTITLTRNNGGLLIAFVAIFVGATGRSLWRIFCFILHYLLSTPMESKDGFHHQRQAIIRNSDTASQGGWQLLTSVVTWKRWSVRPHFIVGRSLSYLTVAVLVKISFGEEFPSLCSPSFYGVALPLQVFSLPEYQVQMQMRFCFLEELWLGEWNPRFL